MTASTPRQPGRRAITLIELLIVVAIIALLAAIVVPALGGARAAGRASVCLATLHNAGLAATMYLDDHDGAFWPYYVDTPGADGGRRWWFGFEPGGPAADPWRGHRPLIKAAGFLGRYLSGSADDFRCPSFPYGDGKFFPKFAPAAGGYGYNTAALGGHSWIDPFSRRPRRAGEFDGRTAEVFVLADGIHFDRLEFDGPGGLTQPFNEPAYIQWQPPAYFETNFGVNGGFGHFRHRGRANALYIDGHASAQPVRRALHPYSSQGYGAVSNLSDAQLGVTRVPRGATVLEVDRIYGLP
jgi:prepilin-type processing-associated H-X9-DG protein/prepilin-type N-terminal cleavage/methylation domain-containing protein